MKTKKALIWVLFWFCLATLFCFGIYLFMENGEQRALEFAGGYVIELSLSVDNLFLFLMIFSSFGLDGRNQRRVLNYGIAGAIVLRFLFIVLGAALVASFHWVMYIFGAILILSAARMVMKREEKADFTDSQTMRFVGKVIPCTNTFEGQRFFIKREGKTYATMLFAVLVLVEFSDIVFAIDSIPAIFSITTHTFIIFTSNMFAILGLRSMYFLLEKLHKSFCYVKYGVAAILAFTGVKLCITFFHVEIGIMLSIAIIAWILLVSILASLIFSRKDPKNA